MDKKILLVDDERSISDLIAYDFRREGYTVEVAYDGEEALKKVKAFKPNVIILDIMESYNFEETLRRAIR